MAQKMKKGGPPKRALPVEFQASFMNKHVAANVMLKIGDKRVAAVAVGAAAAVAAAGALTALWDIQPGEVKGAVSKAFEGLGARVGELRRGSIIVMLYCDTEDDLLTFMEAFETKKVEGRLQEQFKAIGFKGELDVSIINEKEVFEKVKKIRYERKQSKPSYSGIKTETFAKRDESQAGAPGETVLPLSKRLRSSSGSGSSQDNKGVPSEPSASPSKRARPKLPSDSKVKAGKVSIDDREILAKELPSHWEALGRRLKIKDSVLKGIQRDGLQYPDYSDKARAMLIKWQERDGEAATYQVLCDALCHELVERRDLAEKICWK